MNQIYIEHNINMKYNQQLDCIIFKNIKIQTTCIRCIDISIQTPL